MGNAIRTTCLGVLPAFPDCFQLLLAERYPREVFAPSGDAVSYGLHAAGDNNDVPLVEDPPEMLLKCFPPPFVTTKTELPGVVVLLVVHSSFGLPPLLAGPCELLGLPLTMLSSPLLC